MSDAKTIWDFLSSKGLNDYAVAGVMGNLFAESSLSSFNVSDSFARKNGFTDISYTAQVDNGYYKNFINDRAAYGIAQWCYPSRKEGLLKLVNAHNTSISDLKVQLLYLWYEMSLYKTLMKELKAATSVKNASDAFMTIFERPSNQSDAMKKKRANYGLKYYNDFHKETK